MGKKKLPPGKKLMVVPFRLSEEDLRLIDAAAMKAGLTRSQWGRIAMLEMANQGDGRPSLYRD